MKIDRTELNKRLEKAIDNWLTSDKRMEMLKTRSLFHKYSWRNQLLMFMQNPDVELVASFTTWKKMKRFVKKGQHGMMIFRPLFRYITEINDNGEKEKKQVLTGFDSCFVFDIKQTDGKELVGMNMQEYESDGDFERIFNETVKKIEKKYSVKLYEDNKNLAGFIKKDKPLEINILKQEAKYMVPTLFHELGHSIMQTTRNINNKNFTYAEEEIIVDFASMVVCSNFNIDNSEAVARYIQAYRKENNFESLLKLLDEGHFVANELMQQIGLEEQGVVA